MNISIESESSTYYLSPPRRRFKKKHYILVIGLLVAICVALIIGLTVSLLKNKEVSETPVCSSDDCKIAGEYLMKSVDLSSNPCEDFYAFACNNWSKHHFDPEASLQVQKVSDISKYKMEGAISELLEFGFGSEKDQLIVDTLQYYNACMDIERIEEVSEDDLKEFLNSTIETPLLHKDFKPESFNWLLTLGNVVRKTGVNYILRWAFNPNIRNTSRNIIGLEKPANTIFHYTILNDTENAVIEQELYKELITKVITSLNPAIDQDELIRDIKGVFNFEEAMYKLAPKNNEDRSKNKIVDVATLQKEFPSVDWLEYFEAITDQTLSPLNMTITAEEEVELIDYEYLKNLLMFMENPERKRQAANYVALQLILNRITLLPAIFRDAYDNLTAQYPSTKGQILPSRNASCLNLAQLAFPEVITYLYIQHYFPPSSQKKALNMVTSLSNQLSSFIESATWMDSQTSAKAIKKIKNMSTQVGYPDWISSLENINEMYSEMKGKIGKDVLKNLGISREFQLHNTVKNFKIPSKVKLIVNDILSIKATYNRNWNQILISAGMLHSPFYYTDTPWYMNFGAIGTIIGHEMTHGFDMKGRERDENGNLVDWWSDKAYADYNNKTKCFVSQYNDYKVNGEKTLSENIADTGGLRIAYHAYKRHLKEIGMEPKIPYFESFTMDQLFFIAYGSIWCTTQPLLQGDVHSPSKFRLIGSLSNFPEFSEAFNCDSKTNMNPETKCMIW